MGSAGGGVKVGDRVTGGKIPDGSLIRWGVGRSRDGCWKHEIVELPPRKYEVGDKLGGDELHQLPELAVVMFEDAPGVCTWGYYPPVRVYQKWRGEWRRADAGGGRPSDLPEHEYTILHLPS